MNKQITIYLFGNPLLSFDNLPIRLLPDLKKEFPQIDFRVTDPNENIKPIKKELIIIDTVQGINKVMVFNNLDKIQLDKIYSPHDLDLGFNLKLLQKIGELGKVTIFGVPQNIKEEKALKQLIMRIHEKYNANLAN